MRTSMWVKITQAMAFHQTAPSHKPMLTDKHIDYSGKTQNIYPWYKSEVHFFKISGTSQRDQLNDTFYRHHSSTAHVISHQRHTDPRAFFVISEINGFVYRKKLWLILDTAGKQIIGTHKRRSFCFISDDTLSDLLHNGFDSSTRDLFNSKFCTKLTNQ